MYSEGKQAVLPVRSYGLISAAYNESAFIAQTVESVLAQTCLPAKWIIVSDGSTDGTDDIVQAYAAKHSFIELIQIREKHQRGFASKVHALNEGGRRLRGIDYNYIGHLDVDITLPVNYFASLLTRFERIPGLGIGGGSICEWNGTAYRPRRLNHRHSVAGAVQMFRRECYEALGGFKPLKYGGEDWCAEVTARMNGWQVESFENLAAYHHRPTGGATSFWRNSWRQGLMDFSLGSRPLFELFRVGRRLRTPPLGLPALLRLAGYFAGHVRREPRLVSGEFLRFLRREEMFRLREALLGLVRPGLRSAPTGDHCRPDLNR